jgi:hypothetical protein
MVFLDDLERAAYILTEFVKQDRAEYHRKANLIMDRGVVFNMRREGLMGCICLRNALWCNEFYHKGGEQ